MKASFSPRLVFVAAVALLAVPSAHAVNAYWSLNGTGNFTDTANWSVNADGSGGTPASAPGAGNIAYFNSTNNYNNITANLTGALSLNGAGGLAFSNTGNTTIANTSGANLAITIGTAGITLNAGAGNVTIGSTTANQRITFTLSGNQTWTNDSSNLFSLNSNNSITNGGFTLTFAGSGNTTAGGAISGAGAVIKNGTGTLTLTPANASLTGGIVLNAGKLVLGNNNTLGTAASVFTINGGTVDVSGVRTTTNNNAQNWNGDFTFGGTNTWNTGTGNVTMNASRIVTVNASSMTVGGNITGAGFSLTKAGAGILTLNATNNTYSGGTTVSAGVLSIASTGSLTGWSTNGSYAVNSGATLAVGNNVNDTDLGTMLYSTTNFAAGSSVGFDTTLANRTYSANITNTGQGSLGLTKIGANTLLLSGTGNTYTGNTTITAGVLQLGADNVLPSGVGNGNVAVNAANGLDLNGHIQTINGLSGTGQVVNTVAGTVVLTVGANDASSTFNGGISTGTGDVTLTKIGSGTLVMAGTNTYAGGVNLNGGTLLIGGSGLGASTGTVTLADGVTLGSNNSNARNILNPVAINGNITLGQAAGGTGSLTLNGTVNLGGATRTITVDNASDIIGGIISNGGITKNGTGALTVNGNATYSGGTIVNAGNLTFAGNNTFGVGGFTVNNGATLFMGSSSTSNNTYTGNTTVNNGGTLKIGTNLALGSSTVTINDGATITHTSAHSLDNALVFNGNFTYSSAFLWNQNGAVTLQANSVWDVSDPAGTFNLNSGGVIGQSGGVFGITKTGAGKVTLGAVNTFGGGFILNNGTVNVNNAKGLGTGVFTINGGSLDNSSSSASLTWTNNNSITINSDFTYIGTNSTNTGTGAISLGSAAGTTRQITVTASTLTLGGNITDGATANSITKAGAGTLTLTGNNTYTGGTTLNAGTLSLGSTKALGATASGLTINGGTLDSTTNATLTIANSNPITINGNFTYAGSAGSAAELNTGTGAVSLGTAAGTTRQVTVTAGQLTLGGNITDGTTANSITKVGGGTLRLNGNNTYTGGTVVSAGNIMAGSNNAFGTGNITFSGGSFEISAFTVSNDIIFASNAGNSNTLGGDMVLNGNISGSGSWGYNGFSNGSVTFGGNNSGWSGNITLSGSAIRLGQATSAGTGKIIMSSANGMQSMGSTVDLSGGVGVANNIDVNAGFALVLDNSLKLSGVIANTPTLIGSVRLNSGSTGTLYLTGNNTYTGFTNIQASVLEVAALGNGGESRNIGAATSAANNLIIGGNSTGGTLRYVGAGETTDRLFTIGSASTNYDITSSGGPAPVVDLNATVNSKIDSSGAGALVFGNTGSLLVGNALNTVFELSGSNTGNNTIAAVIGNTNGHAPIVLGNSTTQSSATGGGNKQVTVTDTTGIMVGDTVSGSGITGNVTVGAVLGPTRLVIVTGATLNQAANATLTFTNPNVASNKTSLLKSGAGTWVLSGTNTYTGNTTVNAGTLLINGDNSAATGAVLVDSGATLGGSGTIGGATTINGNLAPGNSPGILTFASSLTLNGTTTMQINGNTARGTDFDGINVGTSLTYGGNMTLSFGTTFGVGTYTWDLFGGFTSQSGNFTAITLTDSYSLSLNDLGSGNWGATVGNDTWSFSTATGDLGLTVAVPEPAAWILAAFGLTTAVVFRRRRG